MKYYQSFKDNLARLWQGRFQYGVAFSLFNTNVNRYASGGWIGAFSVLTILSDGTGHWPWSAMECAIQFGTLPAWHIGILGFTVGQRRVHDVEDGEVVGPDVMKRYFFFKGINHQQLTLEEIV